MGVGVKKVYEFFMYVKRYVSFIIFIDEIDVLGKVRGGYRSDEREVMFN